MRACIAEGGRVNAAVWLALRSEMTLKDLFELQDVGVIDGDLQWQMSEFRRTDTGARAPAPGAEPQASAKDQLVNALPADFAAVVRNAVAVTKQELRRPKVVRVGQRQRSAPSDPLTQPVGDPAPNEGDTSG